MTFDKAIEDLDKFGSDERFTKYELRAVIEQLREEYAPTVEMTKKQYHSFRLWRYHTAGWNMTKAAEFARDEHLSASEAMTVWLHPETIKVVDE